MMLKKRLCNEKGVTLIELLAALVIGSIVITVLSMTFISITQEWRSSTSKYNEDAEARRTIHFLSDTLTDSVEVYSTTNEIRYKPGKGTLKAIKYEANNLTMYDYSASKLTDVGTYANPILLASNVASAPKITYNGIPNYTGSISAGALFQLEIPFSYLQPKANGSIETVSVPYKITIKLFKEG